MISDRLFDFNQLTRLLNILSYRTTGDMRKSQQLRDCMSTSIHQESLCRLIDAVFCFGAKDFEHKKMAGWSQ